MSVVGGSLTIAGGIMTAMTAGAAAPVLIAGIATSSVGTAATVGTSLVEKIINSNQIKDMNAAFERDKEISNKLDEQLEQVSNFRESVSLHTLLLFAKTLLGENHLLLVILNSVLLPVVILPELPESDPDDEVDDPQKISRYKLLKRTSTDGVDNSLGGSEVLVEGSKAIGQSIGFSAA